MIEIIPAIDILEGKCVRLSKGDYDKSTQYSSSPLDQARRFEDLGVERLHVVDLDGARSSSPMNLHIVEEIKTRTGLRVEFGGGIKTTDSVGRVLSAGVDYIIVGSTAAKDPELFRQWTREYSPGRFVLGADLDSEGNVAIHGWKQSLPLTIEKLLGLHPSVTRVVCTQISRDGTLSGVDIPFYKSLQEAFPEREITVSGGISCVEDILSLEREGLGSVILGKAYYEGRIDEGALGRLLSR